MLHLSLGRCVTIGCLPKVWRTLRSPNKSPEHQPAAKRQAESPKIQTTVGTRKADMAHRWETRTDWEQSSKSLISED